MEVEENQEVKPRATRAKEPEKVEKGFKGPVGGVASMAIPRTTVPNGTYHRRRPMHWRQHRVGLYSECALKRVAGATRMRKYT